MTAVPRHMRRLLKTDAGMAQLLDIIAGTGNWVHDRDTDCWIFRDPQLTGSERGYVVVRRGGNWHIVPDESVS